MTPHSTTTRKDRRRLEVEGLLSEQESKSDGDDDGDLARLFCIVQATQVEPERPVTGKKVMEEDGELLELEGECEDQDVLPNPIQVGDEGPERELVNYSFTSGRFR